MAARFHAQTPGKFTSPLYSSLTKHKPSKGTPTMANIKTFLATVLNPGFAREPKLPTTPAEGRFDRIDYDLIGLSDTDAMWYYEVRKWRGRD